VEPNLATTNIFLGIMAFTSVLEALLILGVGVAFYLLMRRLTAMYREVMSVLTTAEARHLAPVAARANAILDDVRDVTTTVRRNTDRVDRALNSSRGRIVGVARGMRFALRAILKNAA
jgi:hypothetical protein